MLANDLPETGSSFDVVVFLHPGQWPMELTSNRWHYIKYLDQFVDVIVVQPTHERSIIGVIHQDNRLTRTSILYCSAIRPLFDSPKKTSDQISNQLRDLGYVQPLFWLSTPLFWNVAAYFSTGPVLFHATEDFLRLSKYNPHPASAFIYDCTIAAARYADITLSVSPGVSISLKNSTEIRSLVQSSNGFSKNDYGPNSAMKSFGVPSIKNAIVYCGNINQRIDLALMNKVAVAFPNRSLLLVGPINFDSDNTTLWRSLIGFSNVHYLGSRSTPEINWLYHIAETGIIPYSDDPVIVESGFPLKALEMVSTGLPVVTTEMKSLRGVSPHILISLSHKEFTGHLEMHTRSERAPLNATLLSNLEAFSYEIEIPRVWTSVTNSLNLEPLDFATKNRVKFSVRAALVNTYKLLRKKGFCDLARELTSAFIGLR